MSKIRNYCFQITYWILLLSPFFFLQKHIDNDAWVMLAMGRHISEHGLYPAYEPLSVWHFPDFIYPQWLSDWYFWHVWNLGGTVLLIFLIFLQCVLFNFLAYHTFLLLLNNQKKESLCFTFLLSFFVFPYAVTRAELTSFLALLFVLFALLKYKHTGKIWWFIIIPLVSIAEINLHMALWWIPLCAVFLFSFLLSGRAKFYGFMSGLVYFVCGFINPYFFRAIVYPFTVYRSPYSSFIQELQPATMIEIALYMIAFIFPTIILIYQKRTVVWEFAIAACLSLIAAFIVRRNIGYAGICGCLWLASLYIFPAKHQLFQKKISISFSIIFNVAIGLILIFFFLFNTVRDDTYHQQYRDCEAMGYFVETLEADKDNTIFLTTIRSGGYLEYLGYHGTMDGRLETFGEKFDDYVRAVKSEQSMQEYICSINPDYIVIGNQEIKDWSLTESEDTSLLFQNDNFSVYQYYH